MFNGVDMKDLDPSIPLPPTEAAYTGVKSPQSLHDSTNMLPPIEANHGGPSSPSSLQRFGKQPAIRKKTFQRQRQQPEQTRVEAEQFQQFAVDFLAKQQSQHHSAPSGDAFNTHSIEGERESFFNDAHGARERYDAADTDAIEQTPLPQQQQQLQQEAEDLPQPKMSENFYSNVDTFIGMPPPSLKTIVKKSSGKLNGSTSSKMSVEGLRRERAELKRQEYGAGNLGADSKTLGSTAPKAAVSKAGEKQAQRSKPARSKAGASSGRSKKGASVARKNSGKDFDYSLLAQAMDYVQKVQQTSGLLGDDAKDDNIETHGAGRLGCTSAAGGGLVMQEDHVEWGVSSPPRQGQPSQALRRRKAQGSGGASSSKNRGSKTNAYAPRGVSGRRKRQGSGTMQMAMRPSSNGSDDGASGGRSGLDVEGMVANFEKGIELQRLRAELKESQQRMSESRSVLRDAASDFYTSGKEERAPQQQPSKPSYGASKQRGGVGGRQRISP